MMDVPQEDSPFVLDDRDVLQRLREFRDYCAKLPFANLEGVPSTKHWAEVMFAGTSPEDLAKLLQDPTASNGKLPPHQAFLLAFYQLLETPRELLNAFPNAHRELYYRQVLGLTEHQVIADRVVVACCLAADTPQLLLPKGLELDAGQDSQGTPKRYRLDTDVLVNHGEWTDLRWVKWAEAAVSAAADEETVTAPQYAHVLFDKSAGIAWPQQGARLFEVPTEPEQKSRLIVQPGRVVSSPVLFMSGGTRIVTVTFDSEATGTTFTAQLTSAGKWLNVEASIDQDKTTLTLMISPQLGPITAAPGLDRYPLSGPLGTTPLLKITCTDGKPVPKVKSIQIEVQNLPKVLMSTDEGIARIDSTSYPFGLQPTVGSGFNLAAPDWYANPFQIELKLTPQWTDLPEMSFAHWYENYAKKPTGDEVFVVSSGLCSASKPVLDAQDKNIAQPLFNENKVDPQQTSPTGAVLALTIPKREKGLSEPIEVIKPLNLDPKEGPQWVRIELGAQDFLHRDYPKALMKAQLASLAALAAKGYDANEAAPAAVTAPLEIAAPYTPQLKGLHVSYSCVDDELADHQYLLTPFGYRQDDPSTEDHEAHYPQLYLGFSGITPGQDLNLYWQLRSPCALRVQWQYLHRDNRWKSLDATVADQTQGLFESNLWYAPLPHDASADACWMPSGRYWIRAVVVPGVKEARVAQTEKAESLENDMASDYPWLSGLHTNSVTATLANQDALEVAHFEHPLPACTITRTVENIDGLSKMIQPWPSYGGRGPESTPAWSKRVAQYLRHRGRALTWLDITTLLGEQYPEVYAVRVAEPEPTEDYPRQRLVVIPANGKMDNADRLRPVFNPARLSRMTEFLRDIASPWLKLKLINPTYRDVKLTNDPNDEHYPQIIYDVTFVEQVNYDYAQLALQQALERHYMPWGDDDKSGVQTGIQLDKFEMIKFMQQLDFVAQVNTLTIYSNDQAKQAGSDQTTVSSSHTEVLILTF